jgi:hypothetical protein
VRINELEPGNNAADLEIIIHLEERLLRMMGVAPTARRNGSGEQDGSSRRPADCVRAHRLSRLSSGAAKHENLLYPVSIRGCARNGAFLQETPSVAIGRM